MYCPSCGKSIPDESKFCFWCGKRIIDMNEKSNLLPKTSPLSIEIEYFSMRGPKERRQKLLGSGFRFEMSLWDSSDAMTASDGQLHAVIGHVSTPQYGTVQNALKYPWPLWNKEFSVKSEEFKWHTYKTTRGEIERFIWIYLQMDPLLFVESKDYGRDDNYLYLHVWFVTPEGKSLYAVSSGLRWTDFP